MKIIIVTIFLALIGYIIEQHRHAKYLVERNLKQSNLKVIQDYQYEMLKHKTNMLELMLNALGYDFERFKQNDFVKIQPTTEQLQEIMAAYQQEASKSRSEQIKFEVDMELRGLK